MKPNQRAVPRVSDAVALVFVALVGGCWTEASVPTTITISPSPVTMDLVEERQLTTVVADQNGQVMTGIKVTWSSDVDSIVSVTDGKLVTSVVAGQTRVQATVGMATGSVIVTVTPGPRGWLLKAYGALDGLGWTNRAYWGTTAPLRFWHGVTTDADGNVTGLRLSDNGLNGSIPPGIGILASLQYLDLSQNLVSGPIPSDLGTSASLQYLDLSQNLVSGSIPSDLGSLPDLGYLYLDSNELTGPIPVELSYLRRLRHLALGSNDLTGPFPAELGVLRLGVLLINDNGLSGRLPQSLIGMPLQSFNWQNTGLCAPLDDAFQAWLRSVFTRSGRNCTS